MTTKPSKIYSTVMSGGNMGPHCHIMTILPAQETHYRSHRICTSSVVSTNLRSHIRATSRTLPLSPRWCSSSHFSAIAILNGKHRIRLLGASLRTSLCFDPCHICRSIIRQKAVEWCTYVLSVGCPDMARDSSESQSKSLDGTIEDNSFF